MDALRVEAVVVPDVVYHSPDKGDVIVAGGPIAGVDHVAAPAGLIAMGGIGLWLAIQQILYKFPKNCLKRFLEIETSALRCIQVLLLAQNSLNICSEELPKI